MVEEEHHVATDISWNNDTTALSPEEVSLAYFGLIFIDRRCKSYYNKIASTR
jgi:hypothetical protein